MVTVGFAAWVGKLVRRLPGPAANVFRSHTAILDLPVSASSISLLAEVYVTILFKDARENCSSLEYSHGLLLSLSLGPLGEDS